jgi:hypothetical protein
LTAQSENYVRFVVAPFYAADLPFLGLELVFRLLNSTSSSTLGVKFLLFLRVSDTLARGA